MTCKQKPCGLCGKVLFTPSKSDFCFLCKRKILFKLGMPLGSATVINADNTLTISRKNKGVITVAL